MEATEEMSHLYERFHISQDEREILEMRARGKKLGDISKIHGVTRARIGQRIQKTMGKLREFSATRVTV